MLLVDLLVASWIPHGVQVGDIASPPLYDETQQLTERLALLAPD